MPRFIKGLDLSRGFYYQVVKPILDSHDSSLNYAAGLIGRGSEVLGFDDPMSTDHDWGPGVTIFLSEQNAHLVPVITELMRHDLPHHFHGFSTNFMYSPESPDNQVMAITRHGAVNHQVHPTTIREFFKKMLGWDSEKPLAAIDWLTFPSQKLRALTSGAIFHDGEGELTRIRAQLAWYPDDVWLYLMAAQWNRIGEEEHLMGRAGYIGDDLGASIIAARIVNDVMRLCYLMERAYAPYAKWFGTAFHQLQSAGHLAPILRRMQLSQNWEERQNAYADVIEFLIDMHNQLNITAAIKGTPKKFHTRPFLVADGGAIAARIHSLITSSEVTALSNLPTPIGSIDQIIDETGLKEFPNWREKLRQLYIHIN